MCYSWRIVHTQWQRHTREVRRTEQVLNKLGPKLSAYAMALLVLPQLIKKTQESEEYKEFADKLHSQTIH